MLKRRLIEGQSLLKTAASEVGANLVALNLYPLGMWKKSEKKVRHPKFAANPRPVLLVHGIAHNHSAFVTMQKRMENSGWQNIFTMNYSTRHGSLTRMVEELAEKIEEILKETHAKQVDVVAHSLGGIVARYYMTFGAGRGQIKTLITLGTPHQGTKLSVLLKPITGGSLYGDLKNNSYLLKSMNHTALARGAKITSIFSLRDWTIWPQENAMVHGVPMQAFKNIGIHRVSHQGLLYSSQVFNTIVENILEDQAASSQIETHT